jgi:hypothetical protein
LTPYKGSEPHLVERPEVGAVGLDEELAVVNGHRALQSLSQEIDDPLKFGRHGE